jgi:hypothetical protein
VAFTSVVVSVCCLQPEAEEEGEEADAEVEGDEEEL